MRELKIVEDWLYYFGRQELDNFIRFLEALNPSK